MRGDGATDEDGKVPLILKVEKLFNQYEHRKDKIKETDLFKHTMQKIVQRKTIKLIKTGKINSKEFEDIQELDKKYDLFRAQ